MIRRIVLASETDVEGWRAAVRALRAADVPPEQARFEVGGAEPGLFDVEPAPTADAPGFTVPRAFVALADDALLHRDPQRWALMYRVLGRLAAEPRLLEIASDPDVALARDLAKAVRRDAHKMTAFVRFREIGGDSGPAFVAWYEPEHFIEERVADFFVDRYAGQRFAIVTPRRSILWDGRTLSFGAGGRREDVPEGDDLSAAWETYFRSTFNPARLKPDAMRAEMPKKFWRNLPETRAIAEMMRDAPNRSAAEIARAPAAPTPAHDALVRRRARTIDPTGRGEPPAEAQGEGLGAVRAQARDCRRCDLWRHATQTVFGEGSVDADILFVGEQPGDKEDLAGRPFVGPAGQVFDRCLKAAGVDRSRTYVTNAVKHFKYEPRGKFRLHKKPDLSEIRACNHWLVQEMAAVKAKVVVALGATAVQALLGRAETIGQLRGKTMPLGDRTLLVTVHPSYLLRIPDEAAREAEIARFQDDLRAARRLAGAA